MPKLRSATSTQGRNMAGARALWRATGMKENDFGKPIIAVANSFTQFVPGHVHLQACLDVAERRGGEQPEASGARVVHEHRDPLAEVAGHVAHKIAQRRRVREPFSNILARRVDGRL